MKLFNTIFIAFILTSQIVLSQQSILDSLIVANTKTMILENDKFSGEGWDIIVEQTIKNQHTLIGEDHFMNEIPTFTRAIFDLNEFKNFYIEVDPYTTEIIENSILELNSEQLSKFNAQFRDIFSFYALQPEYELLHHIVNSGAHLMGSDQIVMFSDRVLMNKLKKTTKSSEAKIVYQQIENASKEHLDAFLENPENPMYMMTKEFSEKLEILSNLELSKLEHQIISDLKLSKDIYITQSHQKRVRLLKNGVMNDLSKWENDKTLFKYGANHLTRGESFLDVYDIGNLVANITESNYQDTFHIMILGESGEQGSPFRGAPSSKIDAENGFYLSYLKPFFNVTNENLWYVFDLRPLRKAFLKKKVTIDNLNLERAIRGYDLLVIIPEVTAAKFD